MTLKAHLLWAVYLTFLTVTPVMTVMTVTTKLGHSSVTASSAKFFVYIRESWTHALLSGDSWS